MAYAWHDENGFLGHGPSINGLRQLKTFLSDKSTETYQAIHQLIQHGATHQVTKLAVEVRRLISLASDPDVKSTLQMLAADATKAKGAVILGG